MTIQTFLGLMIVLATANSLLTQAIKILLDSLKKNYSSNVIALVAAGIVGAIGMMTYYHYSGISIDPWMIGLMVVALWVGSMVGYDKIKQLIGQIGEITDGNGR